MRLHINKVSEVNIFILKNIYIMINVVVKKCNINKCKVCSSKWYI